MLFAAETWPFTVATFLMLLIAVVEGLAMVIGANLSEWLQHALPDPWDSVHGPFDKMLGWLHVGRVPVLVLVVLFLAGFAVTGFAFNMVAHRFLGLWVPPLISVPLALLATLPMVRILGAGLAGLIPQDQTYAVSFESLIGRVATIVNGTARPGYPAQARVPNEHGQNLYVMVEPEIEGTTFGSGERILLKQFFDPNNAFDAEGLTRLTEQTQRRNRERNEIEQDTTVAISKKNFEAKQLQLEIDRQKRFAELAQLQEVAGREAEQAATVAKVQAEKTREAEEAKIISQRQIREAEVAKQQAVRQREVEAEREVQIASIEQQRATQIAEQNKAISIAQKSEEQSKAQASANLALADAVKSEQAVKTAEEVAKAEREKQVTLVLASQEAERQAIGVKVSAMAEKEASEAKADAIRTLAKANRENYEAEAAGKRALNEAINMLSDAQISLQEKLALIQGLPRIIEQAVKPMQSIDSIRIVQVDGLNAGAAAAQAGDGTHGAASGNLAEQAVGAALKYRAYAPVLDQLIKEVGLSAEGLNGLVKAPTTPVAVVPTVPANA